jgi:hypothetical protein
MTRRLPARWHADKFSGGLNSRPATNCRRFTPIRRENSCLRAARLSASESSHRDLSSAVFITNITESDFRYTQLRWIPARSSALRYRKPNYVSIQLAC